MGENLKRILNRGEEAADQELQHLASRYGYRVHAKIRVADILAIEQSGIDSHLYSFALRSHFDFVAADENHQPLFAVEFDGPSHLAPEQQERDQKKAALCEFFELPLLRVNGRHLARNYHKASLLQWIVSAWELQKSFHEAQEQGHVPEDEDFDPIMLNHAGSTLEEKHPHWIALRQRLHIEQLYKQGKMPARTSCGVVVETAEGHYRGIEWIDLPDGTVVMVNSAMRAQRFPLYLGDLFSELMTIELYDTLMQHLREGRSGLQPADVSKQVEAVQAKGRPAWSHTGGSTQVTVRLRW
jgi:hypothetical protein